MWMQSVKGNALSIEKKVFLIKCFYNTIETKTILRRIVDFVPNVNLKESQAELHSEDSIKLSLYSLPKIVS